jgi:DNA-binding NarL/FixJ family response regulator
MTDRPLRLVIVDDHALFRRGVRALISTLPGLEVVAEAADGTAAVDIVRQHDPDLVLMDLQMPGGGGLAAIRAIISERPEMNILVVTMYEDDESVFAAMRAGARGYVLKDMDGDDFARAVLSVARGDAIFSRGIAARMITFFAQPAAAASPFPNLTSSEREVLASMSRGLNNSAIAQELHLAPKTVRNYISSIFRKLAVADRSQAIVRAREAGLEQSGGNHPAGPPSRT